MSKQLNIKSDRAYQLASELAAQNGTGLTEAVLHALEQARQRQMRPVAPTPEEAAETMAQWTTLIRRQSAALRAAGLRYNSDKELYDEDGIPI